MCLVRAKLITPEEDIVCYKFLKVEGDKYLSPYQYREYKLGRTLSLKRNNLPLVADIHGRTPMIYKGAFHSIKLLKVAKEYAKSSSDWSTGQKYDMIVMKCIIPKNSNYVYKGIFNGSQGFASQKIKPVEIVSYYRNGSLLRWKKKI
jgi:hypothetical protein